MATPRAVLHPPAFLPRCLNIHTYIRLSYVTAANEEEQKYENATRTGRAIDGNGEAEGGMRCFKTIPRARLKQIGFRRF